MAIALAGMSLKMVIMTFGGIIITVVAIGATVIFSIIPSFTSNGSTEGYGEEYKCPAIMLKSIYTSSSSDSYSMNSIATNPSLSTLSTSALKAISGRKHITGCIISSHYGYGPYNDSTTTARRRRRATTHGIYSLGQMRCFFSTPCSKQTDKGKYSNSSSLSSCVKDRLTATNLAFSKSGVLTEWTPVPNSLTYSIVNAAKTDYNTLSVSKVFGIRPASADTIASTLGVSMTIRDQILAGCTYVGQLSQTSIAAIISSQYTETTTLPTSSTVSG